MRIKNNTDHKKTLWPGLKGSKAIITGASSGLGKHFTQLLADHDVHVYASARRQEKVETLCEAINKKGGIATPLVMDVSCPDSVENAMSGHCFHVVINNAGISMFAPAEEHDAKAIDQVFDTNLKGAFHVARFAAKAMKEAGVPGSIVNIASILGLRVAGQVAAYAASKGGLLQLTRSLALEWARYDIRVNALCPGYIETELNHDFFTSDQGIALIKRIPQRRLGQAQDLDGALLLMSSDLGRYMTGSEIVVDGGHLVSSL